LSESIAVIESNNIKLEEIKKSVESVGFEYGGIVN